MLPQLRSFDEIEPASATAFRVCSKAFARSRANKTTKYDGHGVNGASHR